LWSAASRGAAYDEVVPVLEAFRSRPWFKHTYAIDARTSEFLARQDALTGRANCDYEPRTVLERVHCPVLAIFGARDPLVPSALSADVFAAALRKAGNTDVTIRTFERAGHGMQVDDASGELAPGYLELMSAWILERTGRTEAESNARLNRIAK
jgi:pimeloyl-ACP methyl ester carboxylesterase